LKNNQKSKIGLKLNKDINGKSIQDLLIKKTNENGEVIKPKSFVLNNIISISSKDISSKILLNENNIIN